MTATDLEELERILHDSGAGSTEDIEPAKADAQGLGLFVHTLVGLDRTAAKEAFAAFLTGKTLTANQIEFVDHLTENGVMDPGRLWESPYTDLHASDADGLFPPEAADALLLILDEVKRQAAA